MTSALAEQLSQTMAAIHARGWCDGTGGNFSCVLSRDPLILLMAPSGVDKGTVAPEALIQVDARAQVVAGEGRASAETLLHLEIVARTGAGAVLHTHSQAATLLSDWCLGGRDAGSLPLQDLEMLKGLAGIDSHRRRVTLPVLANDQDLARLSAVAGPLLEGAPHGLLIAGHGLYSWGRNLTEARRHLEILEWLLEQRWRRLLLETLGQQRHTRASGIRAVLLDIEGTTCPVPFVSQVLFPYARGRLDGFLRAGVDNPALAPVVQAIDAAMAAAENGTCQADAGRLDAVGASVSSGIADIHPRRVRFLQALIDQDRKLPALKELQGLIWDQGYASGELRCPLFKDVAPTLRAWRRAGLELAVYSSGSVKAQQLLYRHSNAGDLSDLFSHWFDTTTGPKREPASYQAIAAAMGLEPRALLFVSDAKAELEAARTAGMATRFSQRPDNPEQDPGHFEVITTLAQITL